MANSSSLHAGVVAACLCAAPVHADTIYECTSPDGKQVLQNMPCEAGTEVRVPDAGDVKSVLPAPAGAHAGSVDAVAPNPPADPNARMDATAAANDASATGGGPSNNLPSEPDLGMTQEQVRAILGAPAAVTQEEVVEGRETTWTYGDRALQFDTSGRLTKK